MMVQFVEYDTVCSNEKAIEFHLLIKCMINKHMIAALLSKDLKMDEKGSLQRQIEA